MGNCSGGGCSSCATEEVMEVLESRRISELHDRIVALIVISILLFIIALKVLYSIRRKWNAVILGKMILQKCHCGVPSLDINCVFKAHCQDLRGKHSAPGIANVCTLKRYSMLPTHLPCPPDTGQRSGVLTQSVAALVLCKYKDGLCIALVQGCQEEWKALGVSK